MAGPDYPDISGNLSPVCGCNVEQAAARGLTQRRWTPCCAPERHTDPAGAISYVQALDIVRRIPYINIQYPVRNIAVNNAFEGFSMTAAWTWNLDFSKITPAA